MILQMAMTMMMTTRSSSSSSSSRKRRMDNNINNTSKIIGKFLALLFSLVLSIITTSTTTTNNNNNNNILAFSFNSSLIRGYGGSASSLRAGITVTAITTPSSSLSSSSSSSSSPLLSSKNNNHNSNNNNHYQSRLYASSSVMEEETENSINTEDEAAVSERRSMDTTDTTTTTRSSNSSRRRTNTPSRIIPITIISGFLGSGKTTLLKHILENKSGTCPVGVIVNDVADVNIDGKLINNAMNDGNGDESSSSSSSSVSDGLVQLENGCACCSLSDELLSSVSELVTLSDMRSSDASASSLQPFQHIVIEMSGVSDPRKIRSTFQEAEEMGMAVMSRIQLDTMVTVIDADMFESYFNSQKTASRSETPELFRPPVKNEFEDDDDEEWMKDVPPELLKAIYGRPENDEGEDETNGVADLLVGQTETADVIVLNKCDLLQEKKEQEKENTTTNSPKLQRLTHLVRALNPRPTTLLFESSYGNVPITSILGVANGEGVAQSGTVDDHRTFVDAAVTTTTTTTATVTTTAECNDPQCKDPNCDDDSLSHSHSHSHDHDSSVGIGSSSSNSNSECNDPTCNDPKCDDDSHSHDHDHNHDSGNVDSNSNSECNDPACNDPKCDDDLHSHDHNHDHGSSSNSNSNSECNDPTCNDPKCDDDSHSHSHDHDHATTTTTNANADVNGISTHAGIGTFVYRARRPFHPQRMVAFLRKLPIVRGLPPLPDDDDDDDDEDENDDGVRSNKEIPTTTTKKDQETDRVLSSVLRSKGFVWCANSHTNSMYWSHAGSSFEYKCLGQWWATVSRKSWPTGVDDYVLQDYDDIQHLEVDGDGDDEDRTSDSNSNSDSTTTQTVSSTAATATTVGDRRQEIVFIGQGLGAPHKQQHIQESLDHCLLTTPEYQEYQAIILEQQQENHNHKDLYYDETEALLETKFPSSLEGTYVNY